MGAQRRAPRQPWEQIGERVTSQSCKTGHADSSPSKGGKGVRVFQREWRGQRHTAKLVKRPEASKKRVRPHLYPSTVVIVGIEQRGPCGASHLQSWPRETGEAGGLTRVLGPGLQRETGSSMCMSRVRFSTLRKTSVVTHTVNPSSQECGDRRIRSSSSFLSYIKSLRTA